MMAINFIAHYRHVINYSAEFNHPFIIPASLLQYIRKKSPINPPETQLILECNVSLGGQVFSAASTGRLARFFYRPSREMV